MGEFEPEPTQTLPIEKPLDGIGEGVEESLNRSYAPPTYESVVGGFMACANFEKHIVMQTRRHGKGKISQSEFYPENEENGNAENMQLADFSDSTQAPNTPQTTLALMPSASAPDSNF